MPIGQQARALDQRRTAGIGVGLVALSAIAFSTLGVFGKLAPRAGLTLPTLLALRFGLAGAALGAILAARGRLRIHVPRSAAAVTFMGVLYAGQAACYFGSLRTVPAAVTGVLLYTYPVIVALLARLLFGEPLTWIRGGALLGATAGVLLVVDPFETNRLDTAGLLLGIGSAFVYSTYILCGSRLLTGVDPVAAVAGIAGVAGCLFAIAGLGAGQIRGFQPGGWAIIAGLAVVPTMVAATAFLAGLRRVGPTVASTVSTLEPAATALLATLVLGESLPPWRWVGGGLVVASAAILARATIAR